MGSTRLASPADAAAARLGEQWGGAVTVSLLAKNGNEALGQTSFSPCPKKQQDVIGLMSMEMCGIPGGALG